MAFVGGNNRPTRIRCFLFLVSFTRIRFARFITGSSSLVRFTLCVNLRTVTVLRPVVFFPLQQKNHLSGGFCWWEQQAHSNTLFSFPCFFHAYPLCSLYHRFVLPRQIYALRKFANGYGSSPCCLFPAPTKKTTFQVAFVGGNNRPTRIRCFLFLVSFTRIRFARFITGSSSLVRFTLCVNLRTVTVLRPVVFFPHQQKKPPFRWLLLVGTTGLEPVTSCL